MRNNQRRRGFSLIELLIVIAIALILAAVVGGPLTEHLMLAHETSAISNIRTMHTSQARHYAQFGRYAASLTELGPPASGVSSPQAANLIPRGLAEGTTGGYRFALQISPGGYSVTAVPEKFGSSGRRTFFSDQRQTIRENWSAEPATAESAETGKSR